MTGTCSLSIAVTNAVVAHAFTQPDGAFYPTTHLGSIYWDRLESRLSESGYHVPV